MPTGGDPPVRARGQTQHRAMDAVTGIDGFAAGSASGISVVHSWSRRTTTASVCTTATPGSDIRQRRTHEAAFEQSGRVLRSEPEPAQGVETVYTMTVHKSQGSSSTRSLDPSREPDSRVLTRELLYTAVTHAQSNAGDRRRSEESPCARRWTADRQVIGAAETAMG